MNKRLTVALLLVLTSAPVGVRAANTAEERSELRQRADAYQRERARDPDFQPGDGRLTGEQRQEPAPKGKKAKAKRTSSAKPAQKETTQAKVGKRARSLRKVPGAFVRK